MGESLLDGSLVAYHKLTGIVSTEDGHLAGQLRPIQADISRLAADHTHIALWYTTAGCSQDDVYRCVVSSGNSTGPLGSFSASAYHETSGSFPQELSCESGGIM
jgi:hypothetical protein